jgi:hypothetical protein
LEKGNPELVSKFPSPKMIQARDDYRPDRDALKPAWAAFIRKALSAGSAFAAFKRQIVKDDPVLLDEFGKYIA